MGGCAITLMLGINIFQGAVKYSFFWQLTLFFHNILVLLKDQNTLSTVFCLNA